MKIIFQIDEEWKEVKNWPYAVSNFGRVKRIARGPKTHIGKILKPRKINGYLNVLLCKNGKGKNFYVHKLVAEAFIDQCSKNKEVNHIDGDKENPCVKNLEYITRSENAKHAFKIGLRNNKGEDHPGNKLTEKDVLKIRKIYKKGKRTQFELAKRFDVSDVTISHIVKNKTWRHIL